MRYLGMLADTINQTFERECGKHQFTRNANDAKAFLVRFRLNIDHSTEDGYRDLEVVFWGPMNYVQVWVRETWDVIPLDELEDEDDGGIKPGSPGYRKGVSEWELVADHDSCWRDGVKRILEKQEARINGFSTGGGKFWQVIDPKPLGFIDRKTV